MNTKDWQRESRCENGTGKRRSDHARAMAVLNLPIFNLFGAHIMKTLFARFVKDQSGATAIEYGLIASLIGVAIIGALQATVPGPFCVALGIAPFCPCIGSPEEFIATEPLSH
eukprot:gene8249-8332_t